MSKARNEVIAGDYAGRKIICSGRKIIFDRVFKSPVIVDDTTVSKYEVVDQENSKDIGSAFGLCIVGGLLLGPLGMIAGGALAKENAVIIVSIEFVNGDKSLVEIDKRIYKTLLEVLFH